MQLDLENNRYDVFSQDVANTGTYSITLIASLDDYSSSDTEDVVGEWILTLIDPCLSTEIDSGQVDNVVSLQDMMTTVKSATAAY